MLVNLIIRVTYNVCVVASISSQYVEDKGYKLHKDIHGLYLYNNEPGLHKLKNEFFILIYLNFSMYIIIQVMLLEAFPPNMVTSTTMDLIKLLMACTITTTNLVSGNMTVWLVPWQSSHHR